MERFKNRNRIRRKFLQASQKCTFLRLTRAKAPDPYAARRRKICGHGPREGELLKSKENTHHLHIELTPEHYTTLCAKAKKSGLTKRAFIVRLLNGQEIRERPNEEIRRLRAEIHRIGNNINQIARRVNAGIANDSDAKRGLHMLDQIYELLYQIGR